MDASDIAVGSVGHVLRRAFQDLFVEDHPSEDRKLVEDEVRLCVFLCSFVSCVHYLL